MKNIKITVGNDGDGMKTVDFLKNRAHFSASLVKRVKFGGVSVNGEVVTMRRILKLGDVLEIKMPREQSKNVEPIRAPLDVVYEDEYLLIVNKSRSMPTHPSKGNSLITLANAVAYYLGMPTVFRAINRLDRDTSGLVLIAKDAFSAGLLGKMMKNREITKKYTAVVSGVPNEKHGIIDAPIAREREGDIKRVVRSDGKRAVTEYELIELLEDGNSLCRVLLHTGRTHQIRVHFAHIGHPLVNDFLYGTRASDEETYRLHCSSLEFVHPITRKKLIIESEMQK
jgi:23S rRNA pseudouridine1911/1915/1917 synthase